MAVRLYIGGTAGNKDGEPISNGDMSNPITFDGYDIETGDVSYAQFAKAYLRADEGEEWVGVCLKIADISSPSLFPAVPPIYNLTAKNYSLQSLM